MGRISPTFMADLESEMRTISEEAYNRLLDKIWWDHVARVLPSGSKRERLNWFLDTATIQRPNARHGGGQQRFEDLVIKTTEFEAENANAALTLKKEQLDDLDGNGINLAGNWARAMAKQAVYWAQKQVAKVIKENPVGYDEKTLFAPDHPVNPFNVAAGTYANTFACNVMTVPVDAAVENLSDVLAQIATIPMPNGEDPRNIEISGILHPPAMTARFRQITDAKMIAQTSSGGGGGSANVEAVIQYFGFGTPIEAPELAARYGGSDNTFYLLARDITADEMGGIVYVDREPFEILYHGPMDDAELARKRTFQWTTEGRNVAAPGHPYLIYRCTQS